MAATYNPPRRSDAMALLRQQTWAVDVTAGAQTPITLNPQPATIATPSAAAQLWVVQVSLRVSLRVPPPQISHHDTSA